MAKEIEPAPLFRTWKAWYILVVLWLCGMVVFFYWLTKYFQ